jgi:ring-1,2-phenylacetyl-CoA epoxidase subunit PaaD
MTEADLRRRAWDVAAEVADPEIPVLTIADLGVLRDVAVHGDAVEVTITPTYSGCPAMDMIRRDVEAALQRAGIAAQVRTVLSPAWTTEWMTEEGRRKLREYGIAPPPARGAPEAAVCPHCGSARTEKISQFGSTACKSLWRCLDCREPFDLFKCH